MNTNEWLEDNETNRAYDGKTVKVFKDEEDCGVFIMRVREEDENGNRKPGFIQIVESPYDLTAALHDEAFTNLSKIAKSQ